VQELITPVQRRRTGQRQRVVRRVRTQPKWKAGSRSMHDDITEPERDRAMQMVLPRKPAAKIGRRRNS